MKKLILLLSAFFLMAPFTLSADQFYVGGGIIAVEPGEPKYENDSLLMTVGYEAKDKWRISFTDAKFKHEDFSESKINTRIIGLESFYFHEIRSGVLLLGSFGPGYFMTETKYGKSKSGTAFGLLATGSLRIYFGDNMFMDAAYHYRNASVTIDDGTVNGGYTGLVFDIGWKF